MPRPVLPAIAAVAVVSSLMLGLGVGRYALHDPDEARHAEIGREMLEAPAWSDWVTPRLGATPYRNKPAPFYWLLAASYAWLGVGERAARLVSVVAGALTAIAGSAWAGARWGPRTAVLAGIVLVTSPEYFLMGRFVTLDMVMTLWVTLGVLAVHRFARGAGSLAPAAIAGAFGLLSKGLIAPALIALVGLAALAASRRLGALTLRGLGVAALAFLAVALPWHLAAGLIDPQYLHTLFIEQQWNRAIDAGRRLHARPILFYAPILLGGFFPWSALLPATIRATLWRERRDEATVFCAIWAAVILAVFSLAQGKLASYILPAFPPLALLAARGLGLLWAGVASDTEVRLTRAGLWIVVGVLVAAVPATIVAGALAYRGAFLPSSLWSLGLLAPALGLTWLLRRGGMRLAISFVAGAAAAVLLSLSLLVAPRVMDIQSEAALARTFRAAAPDPGAPLVAYGVQSASLLFYLRRPVLLQDRPEQLRQLLRDHPVVFVVTSPRHLDELHEAGPFVPWYAGPRRVLYASIPAPGTVTGSP
jgi:4-amino-4-deoxy-L-arabinose transferase-like glycosyltransferase